jgi:hypothetical protein
MSGAKKLTILSGFLVILFLMNSCADFFSTTWGEAFRRDPKNVKVDSSNVYDLLDAAKGDKELSRAILDKIDAKSSDTMKQAAIKAANQAAGLTTLVMENAQTLIDVSKGGDYKDAITNVARAIEDAAKDNDFTGISDKLVEILSGKVVLPTDDPREALINTRKIEVTVPKTGGGAGIGGSSNQATVVITDLDKKTGEGIVTVTVNGGVPQEYACVINDEKDENGSQTITIIGAGKNGENATIGYEISNNTGALTLTDLDEIKTIADGGYTDTSNPSSKSIPPALDKEFLNDNVTDSDLTLVVMELILAKYEKEKEIDHGENQEDYETLENYLNSWEKKNVTTGFNMDPDEILIAATVNGMISRGELSDNPSELMGLLNDLLRQKK